MHYLKKWWKYIRPLSKSFPSDTGYSDILDYRKCPVILRYKKPSHQSGVAHVQPEHRRHYIEQTSIQSTLILSCRLSGTVLRFFLIVAPLQSLNGTLGIDLYWRLSPGWVLLLFITPPPMELDNRTPSIIRKAAIHKNRHPHVLQVR